MEINSVSDVKCFCNNKNVLRAQSMIWLFVRHPVVNFLQKCIETGSTSSTISAIEPALQ